LFDGNHLDLGACVPLRHCMDGHRHQCVPEILFQGS
jgi:hypothetical protein